MKNILLTGGSGLLGRKLRKYYDYIAPNHKEMDITQHESVKSALTKYKPQLIVHAAAYTDVSKAEQEPEEMSACYLINVIGTRNIVKLAGITPIIYISSEYVLEPVNFYALTKLQGEKEIERAKKYHIIRTLFKSRPFEHPGACIDMWTLGDYVDVIAPLIHRFIQKPVGKLVYIGTGKKCVYELAKQSRPDVIQITRDTVDVRLPALEFLDNDMLFKF